MDKPTNSVTQTLSITPNFQFRKVTLKPRLAEHANATEKHVAKAIVNDRLAMKATTNAKKKEAMRAVFAPLASSSTVSA